MKTLKEATNLIEFSRQGESVGALATHQACNVLKGWPI